jgi:DNA-binding transcriptional LysR family regulator
MAPAAKPWPLQHRLKLRQLFLLKALGETGNLRRAAAQINIGQPAATRLLAALERALGVTLFERTRRGMAATTYGEAMIRHAAIMLADLEQAHEDVEALARGETGSLRVGTVMSIAPILLPRSLARLKALRPRLHVSLYEGNHEPLLGALARGDLDVLLARAMPPDHMTGIVYELLYREEFRVVCSPTNPLAGARKIDLKRLMDEPWIVPHATVPFRSQLDAFFVAATGRRPANLIESVSILTNQTLLQETNLLSLLPDSAARYYARRRLVSILPLRLANLRAPVALLTRRVTQPLPALEAFAGVIRTVAAGLASRP